IDFLDSFIDCTSKLNILIYYMSRIFIYISNNHLKSVEDKQNNRKYEQNDESFYQRIKRYILDEEVLTKNRNKTFYETMT
ncbi:MAG: hypothetical protein J6T41_01205, partial [Neisseriaceae bacterium]|nr:hypothetical protein [Neisseriaceae bacterium]